MAPDGITVNAVAPGATITPRTVSDEHREEAWAEATRRPRSDQRRRGRGRAGRLRTPLPTSPARAWSWTGWTANGAVPGSVRLERRARPGSAARSLGEGAASPAFRDPPKAGVPQSLAKLATRALRRPLSRGRRAELRYGRESPDPGNDRFQRRLVLGALGDDEVGGPLRGLDDSRRMGRTESRYCRCTDSRPRPARGCRAAGAAGCARRRRCRRRALTSISRRSGSSARTRIPSRITTGFGFSGSESTRLE